VRALFAVSFLGLIGLPMVERPPDGTWSALLVGSERRCGVLHLQVKETSAGFAVLDAAGHEVLLSLTRAADGSGTSEVFWPRLRSAVTVTIKPGVGPRAMRLYIDASQCTFHMPSFGRATGRLKPP